MFLHTDLNGYRFTYAEKGAGEHIIFVHAPGLFHLLMDRLHELLPDATRELVTETSQIMHQDNAVAYNSAVLRERSISQGWE